MERIDLELWIAKHPGSIRANAGDLLDQCETDTKDHAHREAWNHAKEIAQRSLRKYEHGFGYPASDTFVVREVCHEIAHELKTHEPTPEDMDPVEAESIGRRKLDGLDPEARMMFLDWLKELAAKEEHSTWKEIVRFTDHRAKTLIREGHMTNQCDWDLDHTYPQVAARVVRLMIAEFEAQADLASAGPDDSDPSDLH